MIPPMWVTVVGFACNFVGLVGVATFVLAYSRVRFEKSKLGWALIAPPTAVSILGVSALATRMGRIVDLPWSEGTVMVVLAMLVNIAWLWLGWAYLYLTHVLVKTQEEAA